MDLALAHPAAQAFAAKGHEARRRPDAALAYACRTREGDNSSPTPKLAVGPGHGAGQGRSGRRRDAQGRTAAGGRREGARSTASSPTCPRDAEPVRQRTDGPAGTRPALRRRPGGHEAPRAFLTRQAEHARQPRAARAASKKKAAPRPGCRRRVLFNGGVFKADPLRERLIERAQRVGEGREGATPVRDAGRRRPRSGGGPRGGVLRAGAARQGRAHPRRDGPGVLHRRRDGDARRCRACRRR